MSGGRGRADPTWLEVAVDEVLFMDILDGAHDAAEERAGLDVAEALLWALTLELTLAAPVGDETAELAAVEELHCDAHAVGAFAELGG